MSPLHQAAMGGDVETVRNYVNAKRNLDPRWDEPSRGLEGNYARQIDITPLMLGARAGNLQVTQLLVEGGADVHAEANTQVRGEPKTPFDFAVESGNVAVAAYLWRKSDPARVGGRLVRYIVNTCTTGCAEGFPTDATKNMALFLIGIAADEVAGNGVGAAACYAIKPVEMLAFVEKYAVRPPRNTLHCAARDTRRPFERRKEVLTWMLDHGAEVNGQLNGWTPLMGAAAAHDVDAARLLVARGADPNLSGNYLPPIAVAANTCVHSTSAAAIDPRIDAQLAMVQYLAPLSDKKVYTNPEIFKKGHLIKECCARQPQAGSQRRTCEVFGL